VAERNPEITQKCNLGIFANLQSQIPLQSLQTSEAISAAVCFRASEVLSIYYTMAKIPMDYMMKNISDAVVRLCVQNNENSAGISRNDVT
jgi:hypothetical protein